jgi:RNA polymerase sigma-70 factor (ECF subfamily)
MRPELVRAAELLRRSSPQDIEQALALLQNTVYSFSMKVCGHPEDAEDTMQEVLYRSLPHLQKLEDPQALAVWLYTVTRNRCWRMRSKGAKLTRQTLSLDELLPSDAELGRMLEDASRTPEEDALHAEQSVILHQAILRIPPPLRMVLVLHDMEELPTDQVATILGLKPGTVRVRLHRARLGVRQQMDRLRAEAAGKPPSAPTEKPLHPDKSCREIFANLSEYMDGRLEPATCEQMRAHVEACPACVAFLRELRAAIDRCRSLDMPCDPAVADRLRSLLTQEYLRMIGLGPGEKHATHV